MILEENTGFDVEANLKVIGVGGAGGNAVEHMIESGVKGVEFICANTDAQDLNRSSSDIKIPLGQRLTKGRGAGARPEIGREAAEESKDQISDTITGAEMLFVTAGMGGGTGTGASPLIAEIAREMGILTVAVVTMPFSWEQGKKKQHAIAGIEELSGNVDSIITIPNDKLIELGDDVSFIDAYKEADKVLRGAVQGIADLVTKNGFVNVDFADVTTVMSENGQAMMGTGEATGNDRAEVAARSAISSSLLDNMNLKDARGLLVNITAGSNYKMSEHHKIGNIVREITSDDATVVIGNVIDDSMEDRITVTVVATGLGKEVGRVQIRKPRLEKVSNRKVGATGTYGPQITMPMPGTDAQNGSADSSSVEEYLDIPAFLRNQMD